MEDNIVKSTDVNKKAEKPKEPKVAKEEVITAYYGLLSFFKIHRNDGNFYQYMDSFTGQTAGDIDELAALYNASFPNLGTFTVLSGDLYWSPSASIADFYAGNNTTSLYAYAFAD